MMTGVGISADVAVGFVDRAVDGMAGIADVAASLDKVIDGLRA